MALILIAEDALFTRRVLAKTLREDGHEILEACDGCECLEILTKQNPDCLILDLLMPEMNGYEVLQHLQKQQRNLPVIVVTADIQDTARQQCLDLGAIAVINKPPKLDQLRELLQQALVSQ
ncbi:MAG: response regulator [Chroococcales cyanobacterium]